MRRLKAILAMSPFTGDSCSSVGASLDAILSEGIADLCRHYPVEGGDAVGVPTMRGVP
jgi:hypothetical protein